MTSSPLPRLRRFVTRPLALAVLLGVTAAVAQETRVAIAARTAASLPAAIDVGPMPSSQRISLTLTLAPVADRAAALDQFLATVTTPSSPNYHRWVTPAQFAATFGATADQLASAAQWVESNGLSLDAVSPSGLRVSVSGAVSQVESALAVSMHSYQVNGGLYYAAVAKPSLPSSAAAVFAAIDGLDNLPGAAAAATPSAALSLPALAASVDANTTPILTVDATAATGTLSEAQIAGYQALFRQAAAQGITVLVSRTGASSGFPSTLPDVTAVTLPDGTADIALPIAPRPTWQDAAGLPADDLRYGPDVTVSSVAALAQTLTSIAVRAGGRLGNVAATLYTLAPTPGLYTQPADVPAGTWEPATGLGKVDLARLAQSFPTGTTATQTTMTSSSGSPVHGQSFTLSVAVASTVGGATPTGTVTFTATQSAFNSTTVTLGSSGTATSAAYLLPGGPYNITATYSGDSTYASSFGTLTLNVQPEAANFTISAPASVGLGSTVTATVTLTSVSGFGTPNASITVTPSGIPGATAITKTLNGSGGTSSGTFTFTSTQAGTISLQATCSPNDSSFTCYSPQTAMTTVPQATPTITLTVAPSAPTAGTPVTLTAPVTGVNGISPTGSVQFFDGSSSLGFGSAPNATYTTTLLPGVTHTITAVYLGDSNYLKATSNAVSVPVGTAPTTTTVIPSATTATYGQTITLNISVVGNTTVNGTLPTGTLTFTGAGTTTTATVSGGTANVSLTSLPVGTYTITTKYSGDSNYSASTGNTVTLTVTQSAASLNTSISTNTFTTGSTAALTVTVTLPGNAQLPAGSTFIAAITGVAGASYPGTFTVNSGGNTGTGTVTIPAPVAGSYTLQVTCGTNANFTCIPASLNITSTATSAASTGATPTATVLTASPTTALAGQAITLTATVSAAATATAANPIAGSVTFYSGTTQIGTGTIATSGSNGVATATVTLAGTAPYSLTATYAGNTIYAASTSTAVSVTTASTAAAISLSANTNSTVAGITVTFTAIVGGSSSTGSVPTGTVFFYLAGSSPQFLGSAILSPTGGDLATAVFSTSTIPAGSQQVYAVYQGDTNFASATSPVITLGVSDYNLTFIPQSLTLTPGQTGKTTIILGIVNAFPGTVIFGCTPSPNTEITCSFSPTTLTGGGVTTFTVVTTAPTTAAVRPPASPKLLGGIALAALLCCMLPRRRRRLPLLLLIALGLGLSFNLGCSANDFSISPKLLTSGGTPLGTTTIVINTAATDGTNTVVHNYTYQVTIQ